MKKVTEMAFLTAIVSPIMTGSVLEIAIASVLSITFVYLIEKTNGRIRAN